MPKNKHLFQILFTLVILTAVSVGFAHSAHAQTPYQYTPLATVPNLTTANTPIAPATYIQNLYVFAFSIGIVIAVVSGVWAGVEYMLSASVTNKSNALGRIKNVGWGFLLLLCSYVFLKLINPQLVNFNLNLGTINTTSLATNLSAQQQQINTLETAANNAVITAQAAAATAAANPTPANQAAAIQAASAATMSQITADVASNVETHGDIQTAQADLATADQKLTSEATQAAALGNNALASQIDGEKIAIDSESAQTIAVQPALATIKTQNLGLSVDETTAQTALSAIAAAQTQINELNSADQTATASALQAQTAANQAALDNATEAKYGAGCTASNLANNKC